MSSQVHSTLGNLKLVDSCQDSKMNEVGDAGWVRPSIVLEIKWPRPERLQSSLVHFPIQFLEDIAIVQV